MKKPVDHPPDLAQLVREGGNVPGHDEGGGDVGEGYEEEPGGGETQQCPVISRPAVLSPNENDGEILPTFGR